ncbi:unnamed protein product [Rhizophagus irregularis]|nr:unnamed protein product [Rhizophagus irregularis]
MPHHIVSIEVSGIKEEEEDHDEEENDEEIGDDEMKEEYESDDDDNEQEQMYCNAQFITREEAHNIEEDLKENLLVENDYFYQYKEIEKGTFHTGDLNNEQRQVFRKFIDKHKNLFAWETDDF